MAASIEAHNQKPAATWSSGGGAYDEVSHQISSALEHCVVRLDPKPGEKVLDLATGTGWTSRLEARRGAKVTGADIAEDLLADARARAAARISQSNTRSAMPRSFRSATANLTPSLPRSA